MGGRGASSGRSVKGDEYGTEYTTLYKYGNIKFVRNNSNTSAKPPMETMTRGRVYATINNSDNIICITYYDSVNKRTKQIDLNKPHNGVIPHVHHGYVHAENDSPKGYANLTVKEREMVERVNKIWQEYQENGKKQ